MPLDSDQVLVALQLHRPTRPSGLWAVARTLPEPVDALVVQRVHAQLAGPHDPGQARASLDRDDVGGVLRLVVHLVIGEVLVQRAAVHGVEHLEGPADPERGQAALDHLLERTSVERALSASMLRVSGWGWCP